MATCAISRSLTGLYTYSSLRTSQITTPCNNWPPKVSLCPDNPAAKSFSLYSLVHVWVDTSRHQDYYPCPHPLKDCRISPSDLIAATTLIRDKMNVFQNTLVLETSCGTTSRMPSKKLSTVWPRCKDMWVISEAMRSFAKDMRGKKRVCSPHLEAVFPGRWSRDWLASRIISLTARFQIDELGQLLQEEGHAGPP